MSNLDLIIITLFIVVVMISVAVLAPLPPSDDQDINGPRLN